MNVLILKKAEKSLKSRKDRKKAEKSLKSRIFLLKAEEVAALGETQVESRVHVNDLRPLLMT